MTSPLLRLLDLPEITYPDGTSTEGELAQDFRTVMARLNQQFGLVAAQGSPTDYRNLDDQRQNLYVAYQKAAPIGDPAKNEQVMSVVAKVQEMASAKAVNLATARAEWLTRAEEFDATRQKIGELEDLGNPQAAKYRAVSDAIEMRLNDGEIEQAIAGIAQLQPKINQMHALYLRGPEGDEAHESRKSAPGAKSKPSGTSPKWRDNWVKVLPDYNRIIKREPPDTRRRQIRERLRQASQKMWQAVDQGTDLSLADRHSEQVVKLVQEFKAATASLYRVDDPQSRYRFEIGDFERRLAETSQKYPPVGKGTQDAVNRMQLLKVEMKNRALDGDFKQAVVDLDRLEDLLYEYKSGPESEQKSKEDRARNPLKHEYNEAYSKLEDALQNVFAKRTKNEGILKLQKQIIAKNSETEGAAARGDYSLALKLLRELVPLVEQFHRTRDCQWVTKKAALLHALIHKHYLKAGERLEEASKSYEVALKKHKDATSSPLNDFLIDLFFVALGGGIGGAVAIGIKNRIVEGFGKAAADFKRSGALIDATKDIVKFGTRTLPQLGDNNDGESLNLKVGDIELGNNGIDLGRNFGKALKREGQALLDRVIDPLTKIQDIDCDFDTIEIDVDPVAALEGDPFAKILGEIVEPSVTTFSVLIWEAWLKNKIGEGQRNPHGPFPRSTILEETKNNPRIQELLRVYDSLPTWIQPRAG